MFQETTTTNLPETLILAADVLQADLGANQTFLHALTIYLKDSNAYGNTYFARYFEWQGICRERWFFECIAPDMLQAEGVFITKHAQQDYLQETFPFQEIHCELNAYDIRRCSFWLEFRFFSNGRPVAAGRQQIVFAGHDKRIKALPEGVIKRIRRYALNGQA
ncbi:MAG TPA: acyl-CoA thioesterase [Janthinobacterium sp.]|nr:acyl-CoA thioesterase [Janthinobacterium sp.]